MEIIKKTLVVLVLCSFIMGTVPISVLAQQNSPENQIFEYEGPDLSSGVEYVPGELIVKFKPWVSNREIGNINSIHGTSVKYTSPYAGFKILRIPKGKTVPEMVEIFSKNKNVEYAELNYIASTLIVPNDPLYSYQWHFDNDEYGGINMEEAWDISNGIGVIVAVLDTGVAYEDYGRYRIAPDLANTHFVAGYDFINDDNHPNDDDGHGTHVTGTIAQSTNNDEGVAGIAYNAHIMPVKVLDNRGSGSYDGIADGIRYATNNGAQVISMSLGGGSSSRTLENALKYAHNRGVVIVAAAGNGGKDDIIYPAAYDDYVIAVGATQYDETRAYYSSYSSYSGDPTIKQYVDIAAPGGNIYADQNGDGYGDGVLQQTLRPFSTTTFGYYFKQGTSMATPHVSGVAALLIANGVTGPDNVREALESTAEDKDSNGWDPYYGYGIVDAYAALNYAPAPNEPPIADANGPYSGDERVEISFDGSGSSDLDGDIVSYEWDFGDYNTGAGIRPVHTYAQNGTYEVTLNVTDNRGDSNISTTTATISDTNPYADFTATPTSGQKPLTVSFTDTSSTNDGINKWEWDFDDDGDTDSEIENPVYVYTQNGTYNVSLTVYEADGDSNTITKIDYITVTTEATEPSTMHVESILMSINKRGVFTTVSALVTIVNAAGAPVEGATVEGNWSNATSDTDFDLTDASGQIALESDKVKKAPSGTTFTFTVDDVTHSVFTYNATANIEDQDDITVP